MVLTFALVSGLVAVLMGWGYAAVWVLQRFHIRSPHRFDVMEPVIGLAAAAVYANVVNFLLPVNLQVALGFVLIGLLFFLFSLPRLVPFLAKPLWVGLGAVRHEI